MSKPPEVLIKNGHFAWRQQEEPGEEERVLSSTGELTNINFSIEAVSSSSKCVLSQMVFRDWLLTIYSLID